MFRSEETGKRMILSCLIYDVLFVIGLILEDHLHLSRITKIYRRLSVMVNSSLYGRFWWLFI